MKFFSTNFSEQSLFQTKLRNKSDDYLF